MSIHMLYQNHRVSNTIHRSMGLSQGIEQQTERRKLGVKSRLGIEQVVRKVLEVVVAKG